MFRRLIQILFAGVFMVPAAGTFIATPAAMAANSTFYIDCSAGANGSGTADSPWNDLATVDAYTFAPGDQILLKRGTTCVGVLHPLGSGAAGAPIVVDAYGTGPKPIVAGNGAPDAVRLHNQQYWELRDLEVTNHGATVANRRGVYITLQDIGTGSYYRLTNLTVHDVNGDNTKDLGGSAGIDFDVLGTQVPTRFSDVVVDGNDVYSVDRSGINMSTTWKCRPSMGWDGCPVHTTNYYPWQGVAVRNNTVHDTGGDGIVMQYTENGINEYNVAYDINMRAGNNNAGIWAWNADGVTFQYNEVYRVRRPAGVTDGMAFDVDYGTDRTVYQYNYSHDNEGGMLLLCGCGGASANAVIRYNVSQNDQSRIIMGAGATNASFYNNTIYLGPASTTKILEEYSGNTYITLSNNIIVNQGSGGYTYASTADLGHYTWDHNILYGNHPGGPSGQLTVDPQLTNPGTGTSRTTLGGYQLAASSPAIGAGRVIANNGGADFWGDPVPQQCTPDIGADQRSTPNDDVCGIVRNHGFESGALGPWSSWQGAQVVAGNARTGSYALQVGPGQSSAEQVVQVQPNTTYMVSGWARSVDPSEPIRIGVKNFGGNGEVWTPVASPTYARGSVTFTTGPTATSATVYCYKPSGNALGYCDDL
ncbi:carbohydrate binding domain-containing protein, partial [Pedococcus sp.]|uniref:carbohydrate binding domain-containing protein n=1 Tax=Pedococcus sp. TaxID=2860345 RepID=UPI002E0E59CB|nr:carbohydrate binding domain-containing protein [Pedococcus sp.]